MGKTYTEDEVINLTESLAREIQSAITVAVLKTAMTEGGQKALMKECETGNLEGTVSTLNSRKEILSSNINHDFISSRDVVSDLTNMATKAVWSSVSSFLHKNDLGSEYSARPLKISIGGDTDILPDDKLQLLIREAITTASIAYINGDKTATRHTQVKDLSFTMAWNSEQLICTLMHKEKRCVAIITAPDGGKWYE